MADRENVIDILTTCSELIKEGKKLNKNIAPMWLQEAVELLKEQEPVQAEVEGSAGSWWYVCGECNGTIDTKDSFCRHCGRRISWKGCAL